jgi:hypothetical protein
MGSLTATSPDHGFANEVLLITVPAPPNESWIAHLETKYPGLKVRWFTRVNRIPPDPLPAELYDGVTLLCTLLPHPIELVPKVRYVQLISAGADRWIQHELYKKQDVIFCTANGAHAYVKPRYP